MKKKLIIAFLVFTVIGLALYYLLTMGNVGVKYNTFEVSRGQVSKYVEDKGVISSKNIRNYFANGLSKIDLIDLELGQKVKEGQLLFAYENSIQIEIAKVKKQIEALQASYSDALSSTDVDSANSARVDIARIERLLESAKTNEERTQALYESGSVPLVELENASSNVEQIESNLEIAKNTYRKLTKGISKNVRDRYEAEIDVLLLSLDDLDKKKSNYEVYSDIDGIVTELNTFKGDSPYAGKLLVEVQDPSEKVILVDFMVEDAINIEANMSASIEDKKLGISLSDLKVNMIHPKAFETLSELGVRENRQTVELRLASSHDKLDFGLQLDTRVMIEEKREVILVPVGAVYQKDSINYVSVLKINELIEREVITGLSTDGQIEIKEGLEEGEIVIINYE